MTKLKISSDYDYFVNPALGGSEYYESLKNGDDVTFVFADDVACPVKVVILEKGGYADNLILEVTFHDEEHAWDWFSSNEGHDQEAFVDCKM